jgi:hypothetical protein
MRLPILTIFLAIIGAIFSAAANAQEHPDHNHHAEPQHTMGVDPTQAQHAEQNHDHDEKPLDTNSAAPASKTTANAAALTRTKDIDTALLAGGEPIVADVLGVVCDFCALAMNKIFNKMGEVAAIYVDLDTKTLNLVLIPGATLSDERISELAIQAGYRVAGIRRGTEALSRAS